jgi:hypothetical protein
LTEIANALCAAKRKPSINQMLGVLQAMRGRLGEIMQDANAKTPFKARVFSDLVVFTNEIVKGQLSTDQGGP